MNIRYYLPSGDLNDIVKFYWLVEDFDMPPADPPIVISPSGYPELIFNFGDPVSLNINGSPVEKAPASMIAGQITLPIHLNFPGFLNCLCVKLKPYALPALFNYSSSEFTDKSTDMSLVDAGRSIRIFEQLSEAHDDQERIKLIEFHLRQLFIPEWNKKSSCTIKLTEEIIKRGGKLTYPELSGIMDCSTRTMQRNFNSIIGMSPKRFTRIIRFNNAFYYKKMNPQMNFQDIVYKCGYYDLSHFINEFQEFTGLSPLRYFKGSHFYNQFFAGIK